jgi:dTDP-4-dehydrorhamnose reductase
VARALADVGLNVVRVSRSKRPGWRLFDAERDDIDDLLSEQAALVVNCAGVLASEIDPRKASSVRRAELVNERFPHLLAAAAGERGMRVVHISTDAVFDADAGRCDEGARRFADDVYGSTKRRGEPTTHNAVTLRCSFVGRDPVRRRGLVEWILGHPRGAEVTGFVDQVWNGLSSSQVAAVCADLAGRELFERARSEGAVHHLYEDPPLTKHDLVVLLVRLFRPDLVAVPAEGGQPITRLLGTRNVCLRERLESHSPRADSLVRQAVCKDTE